MLDHSVYIQYTTELFTLIPSCHTETFYIKTAKYLTRKNLSTKALVIFGYFSGLRVILELK